MTGPGNRIAAAPVSHSKKLEGVRPRSGGASRLSYKRQSKRSPYERHAKRTKSRPRLRRRRLRPSKQEILTAVRPPRNLIPAMLLRPILLFPGWPGKAVSNQAKIRRILIPRG